MTRAVLTWMVLSAGMVADGTTLQVDGSGPRSGERSTSIEPAPDALLQDVSAREEAPESAMDEVAQAAERGEWDKVIKLLQPLTTSLDNYEVNHFLGQAYRHENLPVESTWHFQRAVQMRPSAVADLLELADLHLARGMSALAIKALESVVSLGQADAQVHYRLAQAYLRAGRPLGRISILASNQAVPGTNSGSWFVLDAVEGQPGQFRVCPQGSAIYHLQKSIELGLEEPGMALVNADIWFSAGQYERARDVYEMIEAIVPTEQLAGYNYRYGLASFWLDDLGGFEQRLQRAVELDGEGYKPKLLDAYAMLAERYCLRGDIDRYIRYLELAVRESPRAADLRYKLGNALSEAQRRGEAAAQWQVVLQLEPYHPDRERLLKLLNYQDTEDSAQSDPVRP